MTVKTPGTPATKIHSTPVTTPGGHKVPEEKIVVTVRLRPLKKREQASKDHVAWDCIDDCTIVYKPSPHERLVQQSSFTFDEVFGPYSMTEAVYEEGVKNVALSALMGINATIFAYGQTSSGKTYTMRGITEKAVNDIYMHILNTPERDFRKKISGIEIYNENVRDLLNSESGRGLKLLDDPEQALDDESFENYKNGLLAKLLEKDPSLQYETNRLWDQIVDKRMKNEEERCG